MKVILDSEKLSPEKYEVMVQIGKEMYELAKGAEIASFLAIIGIVMDNYAYDHNFTVMEAAKMYQNFYLGIIDAFKDAGYFDDLEDSGGITS